MPPVILHDSEPEATPETETTYTRYARLPAPLYECAACSLAVLVLAGEVIKGCACDAPVRANMTATVRGRGAAALT